MDSRTIGQRLRDLRNKIDFPIKAVAQDTQLSSGSISKHENDVAEPSCHALQKYSQLYGVSSDYIIGLCSYEDKEKQEIFNIYDSLPYPMKIKLLLAAREIEDRFSTQQKIKMIQEKNNTTN